MLLDADQEACEVISIGRLYMDASIWMLLSDLGGPTPGTSTRDPAAQHFLYLSIFVVYFEFGHSI